VDPRKGRTEIEDGIAVAVRTGSAEAVRGCRVPDPAPGYRLGDLDRALVDALVEIVDLKLVVLCGSPSSYPRRMLPVVLPMDSGGIS
jgi:hypothetical protein